MRRTLGPLKAFALCVLLPAGAAAQDAVTLYGVVDVGVALERATDTPRTVSLASGTQSGSRWGLRAQHALGSGVRANLQLEGGFVAGTGRAAQGGRAFGRAAWMGLSAPAGEFRLGRQASPASGALSAFDPFQASYLMAGAQTALLSYATHRLDNALVLSTPASAPWQASVGYSRAARDDGAQAGARVWSAALTATAGPWAAALTGERATWQTGTANELAMRAAGDAASPSAVTLATRWTGKTATITAAAAWLRHGALVPEAPSPGQYAQFPGSTVLGLMLGADMALGPGRIMTSWQASLPRGTGSLARRDATHRQHVVSAGYAYPLSARTGVYGVVSHARGSWWDAGWHATQAAIGWRHRF
ncbi:porin [Achromobacter sp. GG226]|uniref:porin n=1 Tax=Verticiella alkaliphila TaxID=2779529 RepID=UPI001C0DCE94|nr:porin [Verticiella sp. GG226]MBU4609256.1 porin [Verticiella sp. GG226]